MASVLYDDYHAAREVVAFLMDKGHRNIGFIGVDESDRAVGFMRKQGYLDEMKEQGLSIDAGWIQKGIFNIESGRSAMESMIQSSSRTPTAVFAVTDRLAIGALQHLISQGIAVPQDMAIVGIGAAEISKYVQPPLTTVDYRNEEAGREAARLILDQITSSKKEAKKIVLSYRLLKRDSV